MNPAFHVIVGRGRGRAREPKRSGAERFDDLSAKSAVERFQDAGFVQDDSAVLRGIEFVQHLVVCGRRRTVQVAHFPFVADVNAEFLSFAHGLLGHCERSENQHGPVDVAGKFQLHDRLTESAIAEDSCAAFAERPAHDVPLEWEQVRVQIGSVDHDAGIFDGKALGFQKRGVGVFGHGICSPRTPQGAFLGLGWTSHSGAGGFVHLRAWECRESPFLRQGKRES
jgi:hypothetical protein